MIVTTHAMATVAAGKILGIQGFQDWFLAFLFGVLVDLDHLKVFRPKYLNNGDWKKFFSRELPVRSLLQEPISFFWVVPLSFYLQTPIIMAAWSLHVFLDYLVDGVRRPFWPVSQLTLKEGILPNYSFYEFLLIPLAILALIS